jgi:hypothetical protein
MGYLTLGGLAAGDLHAKRMWLSRLIASHGLALDRLWHSPALQLARCPLGAERDSRLLNNCEL